ncbi:MAG: DUF2231 domain-containing protein [Reyranellales bacterium]
MALDKPRITAKIAGRPLHPLLRPFAIGYFLAVCACDLVYSQASLFTQSAAPEFASITEWLLGVGLVMAGLAAIVALIDLLGESRFRSLPDARMYAMGSALVVGLELHNLDLRYSAGAGAITPMGLILSLSAIAVLLATPSQAWARMYR